jgi:excisionase family DNA binding protein
MSTRIRSTGTQYISTASAAQFLGVGPTSVKRWADLGLLKCVRTAGNHRRFLREEVERFARAIQTGHVPLEGIGALPQEPPIDGGGVRVESWIRQLLDLGTYSLHGALLTERDTLGSWWQVADLIGLALTELGRRWACGEVSVMDEHLASERLARALARCSEAVPAPAGGPRVLLAMADADDHTLGLSLAELVLREAGHQVMWAGRATPTPDIINYLRTQAPAMVALSASIVSQDTQRLRESTLPVARACQEVRCRLVLGGSGGWPEDLPGAIRVHDFAGLHSMLSGDL